MGPPETNELCSNMLLTVDFLFVTLTMIVSAAMLIPHATGTSTAMYVPQATMDVLQVTMYVLQVTMTRDVYTFCDDERNPGQRCMYPRRL